MGDSLKFLLKIGLKNAWEMQASAGMSDKLGCTSEIKMKNFVLHFVFHSVCTNFALQNLIKYEKDLSNIHVLAMVFVYDSSTVLKGAGKTSS